MRGYSDFNRERISDGLGLRFGNGRPGTDVQVRKLASDIGYGFIGRGQGFRGEFLRILDMGHRVRLRFLELRTLDVRSTCIC